MIRWLFIALFIYMIFRLISGPRKRQSRNAFFTIRYGNANPPSRGNGETPGNRRRERLEHIEEAEFEDVTEDDTVEERFRKKE